jgi:hypothetical protein
MNIDLCSFKDLNWMFPVESASKITFIVMLKDTVEIGTAEWDVQRVADFPPNLRGQREVNEHCSLPIILRLPFNSHWHGHRLWY